MLTEDSSVYLNEILVAFGILDFGGPMAFLTK